MVQQGAGFVQGKTGTFTGTGSSETVTGRKVDVLLDFAGTATVSLQVNNQGTWMIATDQDGNPLTWTADQVYTTVEFVTDHEWRLDCSAHTDNVDYTLRAA